MNAPATFSAKRPATPPTPADHRITVRDSRFGRDRDMRHWWCNGDPVATAWMNALSAAFPRGEAQFIEAVKAFREGVPPKLEREIRAFVQQEVNHSREHIAFNRAAVEAGYDLSGVDARVEDLISRNSDNPKIVQLAATMAMEHYTAMFSHVFLSNPGLIFDADVPQADIWRWHAIEEIEHKAVAYDTYLFATRDWPRLRRWAMKASVMMLVTRNFVRQRYVDSLDLLAQDGITGWRARWQLTWYMFGSPGIMRRIFPAWLAYFMPGFHPWKRDDRALIRRYESEFADAVMPAE